MSTESLYSSRHRSTLERREAEPSTESEQTEPGPLKRWVMVLLGLALLFFLVWAACKWWEQEQMIKEMQAEVAAMQKRVEEARQRQAELRLEITRLHDLEYIAEIARRDYFMSKGNETIFKIKD